MNQIISLPYGGLNAGFQVKEMLDLFKNRKTNFIIIGGQNVALANHPKPDSMDVWLRNHPSVTNPNTRQACKSVNVQLVETGLFSIEKRRCPIRKSMCLAVVLKNG
jgi:hypothetical protein